MFAGVLLFFVGVIRTGIVLFGVGCAMLLIGGRSDAEKKGYRF